MIAADSIFIYPKDTYSALQNTSRLMRVQKLFSIIFILLCCMFYHAASAQVAAVIGTDSIKSCPPLKVHFTDNSTGDPEDRYWDFGNGDTSTAAVNDIVYIFPGTYKIKLKVSNNFSVDSVTKFITVLGAKADFKYTYTDICNAPSDISFIVNRPNSTANYHWDLGDGNKSVSQNPVYTYTTNGIYTVRLQTYSAEGCVDSMTQIIQIGAGKADFTAPATACAGQDIIFENKSGAVPLAAEWKINGTTVKRGTGNLTYNFSSGGTYIIQLTENFGNCQAAAEKTVIVYDKPAAMFSVSGILQSCIYPSDVLFNNNSSRAVAFKWLFGDGSSATATNPLHTYTTAGIFSPELIVYNSNGCTDTLIKNNLIILGPPVISKIKGLPVSGCLPFTIKPQLLVTTPEAITDYTWDFGDGNSSKDAMPEYTYNTTGLYNVKVTVITASGCSAEYLVSGAVKTGHASIPDFTADKNFVCGGTSIQFTGTASGPVTNWLWNLQDTTTRQQNPLYNYRTTGSKTISLTANNNGCLSKITKSDFAVISPPLASFNVQYNCDDRLDVAYKDTSIGALTWLWDFGDNSFSTAQNPPSHQYAASGIYPVTLTATNGSCISTAAKTIAILSGKPVFTYNPPDGYLCRSNAINIAVTNPAYIKDYYWDFGDGTSLFSDTSVIYTYASAGTYYPSLVARYTTSCIDSIFSLNPIKVAGPTASFTTSKPVYCVGDTAVFTDNSISDGVHTIVSGVWNFGDGQSGTFTALPYTHNYISEGNFTAQLIIADNNHCSDTAYYNFAVNALPHVFAGKDTFNCLGSGIQLAPGGAVTYNWQSNPALSCLACTSPLANPLQPQTFYVTGTDVNGCSAADSVFVKTIQPFNISVAARSLQICAGKNVNLQADGAALYKWDPPAGLSNPAIANPVAMPAQTMAYTVTGNDSNYCFTQTDTVLVTVHPNPEITIVKPLLEVQKGSQNLIVTTGSSNIINWHWYPSLGLSCTNCAQPVATAFQTLTYTAVAFAGFGCTDTATVLIHVLCNGSKIFIPTGFTPNGDGRNDRFYITSSIDNPVGLFVIYNRSGEKIFIRQNSITNNAAEGWDGTFKGRLAPAGTYIYRAEIMCNEQTVPLTGTITLVR